MKKRQRKIRLIRAGIQLLFFIFAPALFSTAFAGVKSVFQAIAAHQAISWNSFLDVTAVLLVVTCLFGRHFCGYACAFGSLGDALYELTVFIRQKVFHKKGRHGYSEKAIRILQKVKYIWLLVLLVSILTGWYSKLQGMSPWDVFSMLTAGRLPGATYKVGIVLLILLMIGMCTQERFFCQFLCPMGAIFAIMPIAPLHCSTVTEAPVRRNAEPAKSAVLLIWTLTVIPLSQENVSAATPARESARRGTSGSGFRRRKMRAFFKHELGKDGRTLLENKRK